MTFIILFSSLLLSCKATAPASMVCDSIGDSVSYGGGALTLNSCTLLKGSLRLDFTLTGLEFGDIVAGGGCIVSLTDCVAAPTFYADVPFLNAESGGSDGISLYFEANAELSAKVADGIKEQPSEYGILYAQMSQDEGGFRLLYPEVLDGR